MTFNEAKERVLSALTEFPNETDIPSINSINDFEICVGRWSKKVCWFHITVFPSPLSDSCTSGTDASGGKLEFEIIDGEKRMRDVFNKPWETAYLKFRNSDGSFRPVQVKFAKLVEDDDEEDEEAVDN
ncbi:10594_t:CDS:2 [Acaulospora colombiana]|uniref:10594_t:CDS:1 n=1 Tax=Acaulospora colombiana TaxID=27376 RepID=A0ACA9MU71_9GLOM|nr:10594_t:CDS:2 [Acaulospora colombiana]